MRRWDGCHLFPTRHLSPFFLSLLLSSRRRQSTLFCTTPFPTFPTFPTFPLPSLSPPLRPSFSHSLTHPHSHSHSHSSPFSSTCNVCSYLPLLPSANSLADSLTYLHNIPACTFAHLHTHIHLHTHTQTYTRTLCPLPGVACTVAQPPFPPIQPTNLPFSLWSLFSTYFNN